jgi:ubiquinone/menaquinone biosynthesis C-methylase UbiE
MTALLAPSPVGDELLDHPDADPAAVRLSLANIARANWWFGGVWAMSMALSRLAPPPRGAQALTLLDLGTGDGDLPRRAVRWGARRGMQIRPLGLERSPTAARMAQAQDVPTVLADAGALPFPDKSVDIVMMNLFLHHFAPESAVRLLRSADRVARLGVIVSDLQRSAVAPALFGLGGRLLGFDQLTITDGQTSIARGYSQASLTDLMQRAGVAAQVYAAPGWRLVAQWTPVHT